MPKKDFYDSSELVPVRKKLMQRENDLIISECHVFAGAPDTTFQKWSIEYKKEYFRVQNASIMQILAQRELRVYEELNLMCVIPAGQFVEIINKKKKTFSFYAKLDTDGDFSGSVNNRNVKLIDNTNYPWVGPGIKIYYGPYVRMHEPRNQTGNSQLHLFLKMSTVQWIAGNFYIEYYPDHTQLIAGHFVDAENIIIPVGDYTAISTLSAPYHLNCSGYFRVRLSINDDPAGLLNPVLSLAANYFQLGNPKDSPAGENQSMLFHDGKATLQDRLG